MPPRTESSGALSGLRPVCMGLLQAFTVYGFRGVVIFKTLVMCKGYLQHKERALRMWAMNSCPCPVQNMDPSALPYIHPKQCLDHHQGFWGFLELNWHIQFLNATLQVRWAPSIPTLRSITLAKYTFCVFVTMCFRDWKELFHFALLHSVTRAHSHDSYLLETKMT